MTTNKLKKMVDRAVELDREIREAEAELKTLKTQLKTEAGTREEEHQPTDGGGWSWQTPGESGAVCRVTQGGPKMKASVRTEKDVARLKSLCGEAGFRGLFLPAVTYKPVPNFRDQAREVLGTAGGAARKVIKLLEGKGSVSVSFETKAAAEEGGAA